MNSSGFSNTATEVKKDFQDTSVIDEFRWPDRFEFLDDYVWDWTGVQSKRDLDMTVLVIAYTPALFPFGEDELRKRLNESGVPSPHLVEYEEYESTYSTRAKLMAHFLTEGEASSAHAALSGAYFFSDYLHLAFRKKDLATAPDLLAGQSGTGEM